MERTPLSRQFAVLMGIRFIEPIAFSSLLPFVVYMVEDFHVTEDPNRISMYAGLLASSFALAEFISGVPWGIVSDRIGRKPVLMLGLAGTMVSMLLFGISRSLAWALVSRSMAGLLSGNVGVLKSMTAEMTDPTNRAAGFNYFSMAYGLGFIVGPVMGGFLTDPVTNMPLLFGTSRFLRDFPYFLPCAATALLCAVGMVLCQVYLHETLDRCPPAIEPEKPLALPTIGWSTWVAIASYACLSLFTTLIEELFPFWAATSPEKGGLGFDPKHTGSVFAISGVVLVLVQLLAYPFLQRHFGTMALYRWVFVAYAPVIFLMPYTNTFAYAFPAMMVAYGLRACCGAVAFTSFDILLPETCPECILGKVNGISHSLGSLARAFGPSLCGVVYAWSLGSGLPFPFDYHFMFLVIALLSLLTFLIVTQLRL